MKLFTELSFPAGVIVKQTGETFKVSSFIQLNGVRSEKRETLVATAEALRNRNGVKRQLHDEQSTIFLKRTKDLNLAKAIKETGTQFAALQAELETVR